MKRAKRCVTLLSGLVLLLFFLYSYYLPLLHHQGDNKQKEEQLNKENPHLKNIFDTLKSYMQHQIPSHSMFHENLSEFGPDDALDLSPDDILDLSPAYRRPRPSMVPVTSDNSDCLPYHKDLRVQLVNDHDCEQPHVLVNHGGRLGNKLCQYASVYLLRHLYGVRVAIRKTMQLYLSRVMKNIFLPIQESGCFTNSTTNLRYAPVYMKIYTAATEARATATNKNFITAPLLNQSYYIVNNPDPRALLMDHRDLVRTILRFKDEVISRAVSNINKAIAHYNATYYKRNFHIVTAHARRTDYTNFLKKKFNLTQLDDIYFKRAFDFYRERLQQPVFLVLSDDLKWCRVNLVAQDVVVMDKNPPAVDMATISLGDHHITSYGTFSYMGALLGHGHITHPIGHNRRYKKVACVQSPHFHYISKDKDYEVDNSHVQLV